MSKHKLQITPEDRQRGGFDRRSTRDWANAVGTVLLGGVSVGLVIHASHDAQPQDSKPAPVFTVDPAAVHDAKVLEQDVAQPGGPHVLEDSSRLMSINLNTEAYIQNRKAK